MCMAVHVQGSHNDLFSTVGGAKFSSFTLINNLLQFPHESKRLIKVDYYYGGLAFVHSLRHVEMYASLAGKLCSCQYVRL